MVNVDERILKALEGQQYLVHRNDDPDYADLPPSSVCIEVLDADGEGSLLIDLDKEYAREYTLSFGYHHDHYSMEDDAEICELAETIDGILHNRICAVSIGRRKKDNRFVLSGSRFAASDEAQSGDVEVLFPNTDFWSATKRHNSEMLFEYWDSSKNKSIAVQQEEMHADPQRFSSRLIIVLALFHRYFCHFIFLALLFLIARSKRQLVLLMGVHCLLFAAYSFIGYVFHWKHIFCSYQNAYHVKMTPTRINWNTIRKSDCIGVPIIFAIIGTAAVVVSFVS